MVPTWLNGTISLRFGGIILMWPATIGKLMLQSMVLLLNSLGNSSFNHRFIPPKRWHFLVMSIFTLHNETCQSKVFLWPWTWPHSWSSSKYTDALHTIYLFDYPISGSNWWKPLFRYTGGPLHIRRSLVSPLQHHMAHDFRMRPQKDFRYMRESWLRRNWMVLPSSPKPRVLTIFCQAYQY